MVTRDKTSLRIAMSLSPFPISPLPTRFVLRYFALQEELGRVKRKLAELENKPSGEEVMVVRDITKEEAKEEIRQLLKKGETLYFSDIADKLRLDLEMVVDICRELQDKKEIGIDEEVLATTI
ncbi:hypothetical protein ES703_86408 [subsurface metagenome]